MRTIAVMLAATCLAMATPAEASRHRQQNQTMGYTFDNNGRYAFTQVQPERRTYRKPYKKHRYAKRSKRVRDANGNRAMPWNMVKVKTVQGLYITVHPAYAHKFLKFFEILEREHVRVPKELVGCFARGHHVSGSNHYIGAACDIQTGWNRTIPAMYHAGKWIKEAGLYDGCSFGDCGHIEAVRGTHNRPPPLMAALEKFKAMQSTAAYQP